MKQTFRRTICATMMVGFCLLARYGSASGSAGLTTNSIPPNLFLTDSGFLFWYKSSGEKLIRVADIRAAEKSRESLPAEQYPEGNWGTATNGFQLSLRFSKPTFTNGESVAAVMLMRNVTNKPEVYFRPTKILATKDGKLLKRKDDNGMMEITVSPEVTLFPQTQHRYQENLAQSYNLSEGGAYVFQAVCHHPEVSSQPVTIWVTNSIP